ncbi:hypothetical protein Y032_0122g1031 [Ancylostoma ceylanicum]|uniref:Uncharacterized protein n=1 Tax=Ancylostoma ceylanicum TaxID=53326 RepID=A0A016T8T0_9BILA|nr:hypothetical protein Y032_0122g1031 [Ancylostoma ceylanicum]
MLMENQVAFHDVIQDFQKHRNGMRVMAAFLCLSLIFEIISLVWNFVTLLVNFLSSKTSRSSTFLIFSCACCWKQHIIHPLLLLSFLCSIFLLVTIIASLVTYGGKIRELLFFLLL